MSVAILEQREDNNRSGGSIDGLLTGSSLALADTFYTRRLTGFRFNEGSTFVSFTPSTGGTGGGTPSTGGQFVLAPGRYRIRGWCSYNNDGTAASALWGLFNVTTDLFQCHGTTGAITSEPILSTLMRGGASDNGNLKAVLDTGFVVEGASNQTFEIRQKVSAQAMARSLNCCGASTTMTTPNVNRAVAQNVYAIIELARCP